MVSQPLSTRFYRPALDAVRATAFLLVFIHHVLPREGPSKFLNAIGDTCGLGLCLFFCLSSYLITTLLLPLAGIDRHHQSPLVLSTPDVAYLAAIFRSAAWRIPPHACHGKHGPHHAYGPWFVAALFMCGNIMQPYFPLLRHVWSISIEEQFYAGWPFCMKRKIGFLAAGLLIVIANAALIYFGIRHYDTESVVWTNSLTQSEMFAAGTLLALTEARFPILRSKWIMFGAVPTGATLWFLSAKYPRAEGHPQIAMGPISLASGYL